MIRKLYLSKKRSLMMGAVLCSCFMVGFAGSGLNSYAMGNEPMQQGVTAQATTNSQSKNTNEQKSKANLKKAYQITIGDFKVTLASKEQAVQVLESIKNQYDKEESYYVALEKAAESTGSYTVAMSQSVLAAARMEATAMVEEHLTAEEQKVYQESQVITPMGMEFAEEVLVTEVEIAEDEISSYEEAQAALLKPQPISEEYTIQDGDTLLSISQKYGITTTELIAANPDWAASGGLQVGQVMKITGEKVLLTVVTTVDMDYQMMYYEPQQDVTTEDLYVGEERVVQEKVSGLEQISAQITYVNGIEKERVISEKKIVQEAVPAIVEKGVKVKPEYVMPLGNAVISSTYGERWGRMHRGLDFACNEGTPIYTVKDGTVISSGWNDGGYGIMVLVEHPDGSQTRYAHLSRADVVVGQAVEQGQQIGLSGNTGDSTGPHLHFEIITGGGAVDPYPHLYK